jgi:hypothetical protein
MEALPQEVADYLSFVSLPNPPAVPRHISHTIVREPYDHPPWFRFVCRERSDNLIAATRIVLQSNFLQLQK